LCLRADVRNGGGRMIVPDEWSEMSDEAKIEWIEENMGGDR
jgi:hypothetical protein